MPARDQKGSGSRNRRAPSAGAEAVRATRLRLFDHFTLHRGVPGKTNVELIDGEWWLEPVISERANAGYDEQMRPVLIREPLGQAENNYVEGLPLNYLFGPISPG